MNTDDFEKRLQGQPLRQVPDGWRTEILHAARLASASEAANRTGKIRATQGSYLAKLSTILYGLLWPSPKAWAGLAVTWLLLLAVNLSSGSKPVASPLAERGRMPEAFMVPREEERLLAELLEQPRPPATAERPKASSARPRSELKVNLLCA